MIDLQIHPEGIAGNITLARKNNLVIPTFRQMKNPDSIPEHCKISLQRTGLWDITPLNLFRITWKNKPTESGGAFGHPNYIELPGCLTGIKARIICMVGKWFPTGCHKVGAAYGCLVPRLVTGQFDASRHKAAWPSTGNYCRGGAFNSKLLSVYSIAILPEGMSRERFDWLRGVASEVIATPGTESSVKEIFDKTWELRHTRDDVMIFNQFEEMGNHLWHYSVTGSAIAETVERIKGQQGRLAAVCLTSGSAGTLGCGDFLKERYPEMKLVVGEALQCPTLLNNGYGEHRIEGIGDKHVPWIHNVKNTDMVVAIDDTDCLRLLRLFNTSEGRQFLIEEAGVEAVAVNKLVLLGISGIANVLCAIKTAKYYEMTENDIIVTVLTDSAHLYASRIDELAEIEGAYSISRSALDFCRHILSIHTDNMKELSYRDRKRIHDLKYYTWVEQQGKTVDELDALWYSPETTWHTVHRQEEAIDDLIMEFNHKTGLL